MSEIITVHLDQKPIYDIVIEKDFSQLGTAFSRLNVTGRKICIVTWALFTDDSISDAK